MFLLMVKIWITLGNLGFYLGISIHVTLGNFRILP